MCIAIVRLSAPVCSGRRLTCNSTEKTRNFFKNVNYELLVQAICTCTMRTRTCYVARRPLGANIKPILGITK